MKYEEDKRQSDLYVPEIKSILGRYLVGVATTEQDQHEATDLIVLKVRQLRVACRVRNEKYLAKYGKQFTIRSERLLSGNKTELEKIKEGWGDWFFYGFGDKVRLLQWFIGDLRIFRQWLSTPFGKPLAKKRNHDFTSDFQAFELEKMPAEFLIGASWWEL